MALVSMVLAGLLATSASAPAANADIVGTWQLVSTSQTLANGSERSDPDLGDHPAGYMMYDASGHMCTVFSNSDRPRWDSPEPTDAEAQALFDKMVVYCARYRMDRAGGKIVFDMEFGHSPNLTGSTRERRFQLKGDALILFPTPLPPGVTAWSVHLKRVSR